MGKDQKKLPAIFSKALGYIQENVSIAYSLLLLFLVPAAFFADNYIINSSYEKAIDLITQRKAVLAENIFNRLAWSKFSTPDELQPFISQVMEDNQDIVFLTVLRPAGGTGACEVLAASDLNEIGQIKKDDPQNFLAWSRSEGIAFLDKNKNGRFWQVTKAVLNQENEKIGLVSMSLSLADSDAVVNEVITYSYWILAIIVLALVLLLANQTRLLEYGFKLNKLKEVDKMKDMFISMASHELRAPLTAINGYIDLMKGDQGFSLQGESKRYFENISASSERLAHLVEDILEVSRLEGNRFPLEISNFNPYPLIGQSVEEMRSQAIQKNLKLFYEASGESIEISADPARVKQIVVNLIGNALKYTQKGSIKITASVKNREFMITVADTGIGISSEEQANLFQKFYRIKNEQTKNISGTGLGLWITAETIKRMNGKITVESIEGVGTHFTAHLPLAKK